MRQEKSIAYYYYWINAQNNNYLLIYILTYLLNLLTTLPYPTYKLSILNIIDAHIIIYLFTYPI